MRKAVYSGLILLIVILVIIFIIEAVTRRNIQPVQVPQTTPPVATQTQQTTGFKEGVNYNTVHVTGQPQFPAAKDGKVNVVEVFSYACPHCFEMNRAVQEWEAQMPEYVNFSHQPITWGMPYHIDAARMFYYLKQHNEVEQQTYSVFSGIHVMRSIDITNNNLWPQQFCDTVGGTGNCVQEVKTGFKKQLEYTDKLIKNYNLFSVPSFYINNKYYFTRNQGNADNKALLNYLVKKVHDEELAQMGKSTATKPVAANEPTNTATDVKKASQ